jgi:hypothetical protein
MHLISNRKIHAFITIKQDDRYRTNTLRLLDLLTEDVLEGDSIGSEFRDTLAELLGSHLVLVEVEAEGGLVVDVALLLNVKRVGLGSIELLGNGLCGVVQLLEKVGLYVVSIHTWSAGLYKSTYSNGEVVASSELSNLANGAERSTHDDGLVAVLLVVVEDAADGLDTGVLLLGVLLLGRSLVPVKNAADEGGDEESAGLSSGNSLDEREHQSQVGVDAVIPLEDLGGLDTLPCRGDLDKNALLANALLLVQLQNVRSKCWAHFQAILLTSMMRRALLTEAFVSKEKRASTSVETLPGTTLRISLPNWTRRLSSVASTWSSMLSAWLLPQVTAASMSFSYSGFLEAARIREGLVVASWGLYLSMVAKSPESQTTVCEELSAHKIPVAWQHGVCSSFRGGAVSYAMVGGR